MFGNTVAFAGAEDEDEGDEGSEEGPGAEGLGTCADIAVDFPPQPQTEKTMIDEKTSATVFKITVKNSREVYLQVFPSNNPGSMKIDF
jgi:hypothetical protein